MPGGSLPSWCFWKYSRVAGLRPPSQPVERDDFAPIGQVHQHGRHTQETALVRMQNVGRQTDGTPASTALPPRLSTSYPAIAAAGWLATTTAFVPRVRGRRLDNVVPGTGMLLLPVDSRRGLERMDGDGRS